MISNMEKSEHRTSYRSERLPSFNKFVPIQEHNTPSLKIKEKPIIIVENYESENDENEIP